MPNGLMTLDGLIGRLQEIREDIGHDCDINVLMNRGNKSLPGRIEMVCSDYKDEKESVLIDIDEDALKWFEK
jgi:hypothetical protein